jgi:hypothetical protein
VGEEGVDDGRVVGDCCVDEGCLGRVGGLWSVIVSMLHGGSLGGMGRHRGWGRGKGEEGS